MKKLFYSLLAATALVSCTSKPLELNVMSFNIRYDNPEDSLDNWQYRKDVAAKVIQTNDIDILGAQEVLSNQLADLKDRLPQYNTIGVGREDGIEKGEYSALLYKKDRFTEVKSGYFWLSSTPEIVGSKGWDGACERIATWVILSDKETGKEVFAINTHLDHVGKVARQEGVTLLLTRAAELSNGLPVIMTGDFNADPQSEVIKHVTNEAIKEHLINTRSVAKEVTGTEWTFHDFGKLPLENREIIDYIFISKQIEVDKFEVLSEKLDDVFLSDHTPIIAKIKIN